MTHCIMFVLNSADYFLSHRLALAKGASRAGYDIHVAAPPAHATRQIEQEGFTFHPFPLSRRGMNPVAEARSIAALKHIYRQVQPDLVHHLTIKPMIYGGIAARRAKVPAMVQAVTGLGHTFLASGLKASALRKAVLFAYRMSFRHPNMQAIFQNQDDQAALVGAGVVDSKETVVIRGSGVDTKAFAPTNEPAGPIRVVLASRMLWTKGVGELVEAASRIQDAEPAVEVVLVGGPDPGNPASIPASKLEEWGRQRNVKWLGHQSDIRSILREAHIVCLPSHGEGVPKILIEAAACGKPIVATDVQGCREIVRHEVNGLLVPLGDVDALASALQKLAADPALREKLGQKGREIAVNEFSQELVIEQTLEVYRTLLAGGSRA